MSNSYQAKFIKNLVGSDIMQLLNSFKNLVNRLQASKVTIHGSLESRPLSISVMA